MTALTAFTHLAPISQEPIDQAAGCLLCYSPEIANPSKIRAVEYVRESFSPSAFIRPVLGFKLCDEHELSAQHPLKISNGILSQALSRVLPVALGSLLLPVWPLCLAHRRGC